MTLDEVIERFNNNAEYERSHGSLLACLEFRQFAEWLGELKKLKEQTEPCEDCISRQAAIEFLKKPLSASCMMEYLENAPSVQPEIIRCCQCKYAEVADPEDSQDGYTCQFHRGSIWFSGSYCSWAERSKADASSD